MRANLNRTGPRFRIPLPSSPSGLALGGAPDLAERSGGATGAVRAPALRSGIPFGLSASPSALPGGGLAEGEEKRRRKKRKKTNLSERKKQTFQA